MKHHGFSLPEALVASAILAIVVTGVLTMVGDGSSVSDVFRTRVQGNNSCLMTANQLMGTIKERGVVRSRFNFPFTALGTGWAAGTDLSVSTTGVWDPAVEKGILHLHRWPSPIYSVPGSGDLHTKLNPHHLIMGYMNALQAMYNSDIAGFCSAAKGTSTYNSGTLLAIPDSAGLKPELSSAAPVATLKIVPFLTTTGVLQACSAVDIRPPRPDEDAADITNDRRGVGIDGLGAAKSPNLSTVEVFDFPTTVPANNLGFAVTVTVTHQDRSGTDRECSVSERFQYAIQPRNPLALNFEDIDDPGAAPEAVGNDSDGDMPDNINTTTRISTNPAVVGTNTAISNPPSYADSSQTLSTNNTIYYSCGATVNRSVNLRLANVRPGSIMMCRNLSKLRVDAADTTTSNYYAGASGTIDVTADNAAVERMDTRPTDLNGFWGTYGSPLGTGANNGVYGIRQSFYSSELLEHAYYAGNDTDADGELYILGMYYPAGDYWCVRAGDNCKGLPILPYGADNTSDFTNNSGGVPASLSDVVGSTTAIYFPPSNHSAATDVSVAAQWVPCERLANVCGVSSADVVTGKFVGGDRTDADLNDDKDGYHLRIGNLPRGCEVHIQMAEVDAGYNVKMKDFREYMQEQVPGNWLCRTGNAAHGSVPARSGFNERWYFWCGADGSRPSTATCASVATDPDAPCCTPFPAYPSVKPYVEQ